MGKSQVYNAGVERVEIWFGKDQPVPYLIGVPAPVKFEFKGRVYDAKLRASERAPKVWLSPTLQDQSGPVRLADVLRTIPMNAALDVEVFGQHLKVVAVHREGLRARKLQRRLRRAAETARRSKIA